MRTTSALIMSSAALLQLSRLASAETCASYVDYATGNTLCGASGILTTSEPEDITCTDPLVCTFAECCEVETCDTGYDTTSNCGSGGLISTAAGDPTTVSCAAATCTFTECCNPEKCDAYTDDGTNGGNTLCPNQPIGAAATTDCDGPDGACTFATCCDPQVCSNWAGHTGEGGNACFEAGLTQLADGTTPCAGETCSIIDCCTPTCATGKVDKSGDPFVCTTAFEALLTANLDNDCGGAGGGGDEVCTDAECCGTGVAYCGDGAFTCSVPGEGVPAANFAKICTNECDDVECGCAVAAVTCRQELHSCSSGSRIDDNSCPDGIGTCTDALCCETESASTITESRMMRTPRSRISMNQYGA